MEQGKIIRDPSTGETVLLAPSIDDLDLTTLPDRLDDPTLARVQAIARSPLPDLPPCDSRTIGQALRMMLAVLPRRHADDLSGELFVAAYDRQLGSYPAPAIQYLCDEAIRTQQWFPTVVECHEIIGKWVRRDAAVERRLRAQSLAYAELRRREGERPIEPREPLPRADIATMTPELVEIGLKCGALVRDEAGNVEYAEAA